VWRESNALLEGSATLGRNRFASFIDPAARALRAGLSGSVACSCDRREAPLHARSRTWATHAPGSYPSPRVTSRESNRAAVTGCDTERCHDRVMASRSSQLTFDLRATLRWGGRRAGAGRPCGSTPRDPHRRRAPLAARFPCHVTLRIRRGIPSLRKARLVREWRRGLCEVRERARLRVVHYSLQRDHAHLIVEAASAHDLACGMKSIGAQLARAVNRTSHRRGPVLAARYHLRVLRTPREVAPPRTWLLSIGWRWHGLVDPAELPGR